MSDEHGYYLDLLTKILSPRMYCCPSTSKVSYGELRYNKAQEALDDKIEMLQWIVGQFVSVQVPYRAAQRDYDREYDHVPDQVTVCRAKFDQYPYEELLARAYHLRLFQPPAHTVHSFCKHYYRESFSADTIYPSHWSGDQQDIPIPLIDLHQVLTSHEEYTVDMINRVRNLGIFMGRNYSADVHTSIRLPVTTLQYNVNLMIPTLQWLKCHDHVSESVVALARMTRMNYA